ncbi:hypothetical protein YQE_12417, partial [Dendroctonus ponderosae]
MKAESRSCLMEAEDWLLLRDPEEMQQSALLPNIGLRMKISIIDGTEASTKDFSESHFVLI